ALATQRGPGRGDGGRRAGVGKIALQEARGHRLEASLQGDAETAEGAGGAFDVEDSLALFSDLDVSSVDGSGGAGGGIDRTGESSQSAATAGTSAFQHFEIDLSSLRNRSARRRGARAESDTEVGVFEPIQVEEPDFEGLHPVVRERLASVAAGRQIVRLFPPVKSGDMFSRSSSTSSLPRESDSLLYSERGGGSAGGNLTSYDDKHGGEYVFSKSGGVLVSRSQPHCCPVCCTIYSLIGVIYLSCLGTYAAMGWNYTHPGWTEAQQGTVTRNAFSAALLYLLCAAISIFYWRKQSMYAGYAPGIRRVGTEGFELTRDLDA
ncbi:Uncharacterized protein SCF082_LOCUS23904, partial [Durusdinium trenchii]